MQKFSIGKMDKMGLAELQVLGVLQEANRLFFHPLGLALAFVFDDDSRATGEVMILATEDPEGIAFLPPNADKGAAFERWQRDRCPDRYKQLGWKIEPLGGKES